MHFGSYPVVVVLPYTQCSMDTTVNFLVFLRLLHILFSFFWMSIVFRTRARALFFKINSQTHTTTTFVSTSFFNCVEAISLHSAWVFLVDTVFFYTFTWMMWLPCSQWLYTSKVNKWLFGTVNRHPFEYNSSFQYKMTNAKKIHNKINKKQQQQPHSNRGWWVALVNLGLLFCLIINFWLLCFFILHELCAKCVQIWNLLKIFINLIFENEKRKKSLTNSIV